MSSKVLRCEPALVIVRHAVTAVLVFLDTLQENGEERIGQEV
jgi:hypothetical protein